MSLRLNRLLLLLASFCVVAAGCGGGGGPSTPPVLPTSAPTGPSPTPTPSPTRSPSPSPSPTASNASVGVSTRPLHAGDTFTYSGTSTQTFVYGAAGSPTPSSTTQYTIGQSVVDNGLTTFNANGAYDFETVETDASNLQTITVTTHTYYNTLPGGALTDFVSYGYTSSDSNGEQLTVNYGPGSYRIFDELPESSGQSFDNNSRAAQTLSEAQPGGTTATRTTNADGSYVDSESIPQTSQFTPQPSPIAVTITQNADGSGSYLYGPAGDILSVVFTAPSGGSIGVTLSNGNGTTSGSFGAWFPPSPTLFSDAFSDTGQTAIPGACNVPSSLGTQANELTETQTTLDTVVGYRETLVQNTYVVPTYGAACVTLNDTTLYYYDYSGQSPALLVVGSMPVETQTVTTTLGLTGTNVVPNLVRRESPLSRSGGAAFAIANARANFVASVERRHFERRLKMARALRRYLELHPHGGLAP